MRKLFMYFLGILFISAAGTTTYSDQENEINARGLFEKKCSICHSINRPKSKTKTAEEWKQTVMRMKNVNGCPVTNEEAEIIIDYLTENYGM
jgi:cytochrome c-type biogenesis protein CcmH/NrfF